MFKSVFGLFAVLTSREKRSMVALSLAVALMAVLEVVGIGAVGPFISVAAAPQSVFDSSLLYSLYTALGFTSVNAFVTAAGVALCLVILVANAYAALVMYWIFRWSSARMHSFARRLLSKYLYEPYVFHLDRNSSELSKNVLGETTMAVSQVLRPAVEAAARGLTALAIVAYLLVTAPFVALLMGATIGGAYAAVYAVMRRRISALGPRIREENEGRYRAAAEALGGIKPIKVAGCEPVFADRVARYSEGYAWSVAQVQIYSTLPRYLVESIGIGLIVLLTLVLSKSGGGFQSAVPLVSVYAFAGYKLMPALLTVFRHLTTIKAGLPMADALRNDLAGEPAESAVRDLSRNRAERLPFERAIDLVNVRFSYGRGDAVALDGIDLTIRKNETVAFVGTTGCGKTTLIDSILGLLTVAGEIRVDGQVIHDGNLAAWQRNIGYVPQDIYLIDDSVARNIAFGVPDGEVDRAAVENAARVADLHDFVVNELPRGYETVVGERGVRFSGGQRQRIGIARALYHDPNVLILDEATSSLDTITERIVMQAVHDLMGDKTILMIAHRISTVVEADRIFLLDRGKVVAEGSYESLLERSERFKSLAGVFHGPATTRY